jgi:hypothetical protein
VRENKGVFYEGAGRFLGEPGVTVTGKSRKPKEK